MAKLAFLSDKAGKTRIVYILNYWMQQLMLPLHDAMMHWLGQQVQDATWDQESAVQQLLQWSKEDIPLYSFDLTAATDRWPKWHQKLVVTRAFGSEWAEAWDWCLSTPAFVPHLNREVSYAVGQPMGAYASWAALAMAHHSIIRYAAWRLGVPADYKVLGDDVVIRGRPLATEYQKLILSLGVTISQGKSVIPKEGQPNGFEFAKNVGSRGINYTAVSPNLLKEIWEDYLSVKFLDLIRLLKDQYGITGYIGPENISLPPLLYDLYSTLPCKARDLIAVMSSHPMSPVMPLKEGITDEILGASVSWKAIPNPWSGYSKTTVVKVQKTLSMTRATTLMDNLLKIGQTILDSITINVDRESLGSSRDLTSNFVPSLYHPIWRIISSLVCILRDLTDNKDNNPSKTRMVQIECEFVTKLLRGNLDIRAWQHSKLLRHKQNAKIAQELWTLLKSYTGREKELLMFCMSKNQKFFTSTARQFMKSERLWANTRNLSGHFITEALWTSSGGKSEERNEAL